MQQALTIGSSARARGLVWQVIEAEPAGEQTRYRLRCLEGDLRGSELDLLSPAEAIEPVRRELDPGNAGRLQHWRLYHEAYLLEQALGPRELVALEPGRLDLVPYQLVPVMRALEMPRPRLLLADAVGLGKTVEAGIVTTELVARRRAHRVLVVSPAGPLLNQWDKELRLRFGLRFTRVTDWGTLQELRRTLELGANPFNALSFCLISIDFAKQEKVLQDLERSTWDLVIIDEAHHCVSLGSAGEREDSQRRRLAEVLAAQADGLLLLTATPHDGFDAHFASLIELLDGNLTDGRGGLRGDGYRRVVVRRLKSHIKNPETGKPLFQTREVAPCPVVFDAASRPAFARFQLTLLELVSPRIRRALQQKRYAEVLALVALLKRSVSTVMACRNTLGVVAERYARLKAEAGDLAETRRQRLRTLRDYRRRLERFGTLSFEEEQDHAQLEAEDIAQEIVETGAEDLLARLRAFEREDRRDRRQQKGLDATHEALMALIDLAEQAEAEDPKLPQLLSLLKQMREAEPNTNILVYTEYTDSQDAIVRYLQAAVADGRLQGTVEAISGRDSAIGRDGADRRTAIAERFGEVDGIVLVSTDATAEGLNLHQRCHHLIHFELPYNPNRLEQRNGRIDRFGQERVPYVWYLYLAGTFEERLLLRLVWKYEQQRAKLTFMPNTLGVLADDRGAAAVKLLEGLAEEDGLLFRRPAVELKTLDQEVDDAGSPAYRDMLAEIERALSGFRTAARSHAWLAELGLNADEAGLVAAQEALRQGARDVGRLDLLSFIREAIEAETGVGQAARTCADGVVELFLPPDWTYGLDDMPGYDAERRLLRITTDRRRLTDDAGQPLGFIGRAHPLVRRAIDRVRRSEAISAEGILDRRVSAARGDASARPAAILTFSTAVTSERGPEYQRIVAAKVTADAAEPIVEPDEWMRYAAPDRAIPTRNVWERHFSAWLPDRRELAAEIAATIFKPLALAFIAWHAEQIAEEERTLARWIEARAQEICGPIDSKTGDLFTGSVATSPPWQLPGLPIDRLVAFSSDKYVPASARREAETAVELYQSRHDEIQSRKGLTVEPPRALGLLMLVPPGAEG